MYVACVILVRSAFMRHQLEKLTEEYLGADQDGVAKGLLTALEHGNPGTND